MIILVNAAMRLLTRESSFYETQFSLPLPPSEQQAIISVNDQLVEDFAIKCFSVFDPEWTANLQK